MPKRKDGRVVPGATLLTSMASVVIMVLGLGLPGCAPPDANDAREEGQVSTPVEVDSSSSEKAVPSEKRIGEEPSSEHGVAHDDEATSPAMESQTMSQQPEAPQLDDAIAIARQAVEKLGKDPETLSFAADEANTEWNDFIDEEPFALESPPMKAIRLEGREYWVVYFAPGEMVLGGDGYVFVDKNTGEVLGIYRGR